MTPGDLKGARAMVAHILTHSSKFYWTLQGFGMLRLHLPDHHRLHVWSSRHAVPNVSTIHDHLQWGLESTIICGQLVNRIFDCGPASFRDMTHMCATIKPGIGTFFRSDPEMVSLLMTSATRYLAGETYRQEPAQIHESAPEDGCVTLVRKLPTADDSARIFWPIGTDWVSAEPRPATADEVSEITGRALARLRWEMEP